MPKGYTSEKVIDFDESFIPIRRGLRDLIWILSDWVIVLAVQTDVLF